jgi:aspartate/methionine/tyrosine aminotransferase
MGDITPFLAMEIMERAQELDRAGADVVHLEVGEPDFDVPDCVKDAADRAVRDGHTHYTHSLGLLELREAIAEYYAQRYRVAVPPNRVIVTTGTSGGLILLMALLTRPGGEVLLSNPGYACYPNFIRAFHASPRRFVLPAVEGFRYHSRTVRAELSEMTCGLLVNSPANPTAAIQPRSTLAELASLPVPVISDEIYHGLEYGEEPAACMLELTDDAFVLDGFSKRYAMTGFRIGWLVAPAQYVAALQRLQQNLFICAGSVAQHAAIAALRYAQADVERMRAEYQRRRDLLVSGLSRLGFGIPAVPQGAYYLLADASHLCSAGNLPTSHATTPISPSVVLARRILEEAHVGVGPGIDFGTAAEGHLRFSFASGYDRIEEGLRRLARWLERTRL